MKALISEIFNRSILTVLFLSITVTSNSQNKQFQKGQDESSDAVYTPVDKSKMARSPAYSFSSPNYFTRQVNIDTNGNNILGDAANEPSIAVDPTNPNRVVMGWRQFDDVNDYYRQAGYAYSLNGGYTWVNPGVIEPGVFRTDPVLDFDAEGNFYYNSLRPQLGWFCDVFSITDGGVNWEHSGVAYGGDKQWMEIDKSESIGSGNNYSFWTVTSSVCAPGQFTRSTDGSQTFDDCVEVDENPFWGTLAVDSNGILYLAGTTDLDPAIANIVVLKSTTARDSNSVVSWDFTTIVDLDGFVPLGSLVNPGGLLGQVCVDVDVSGSIGDGTIYVLASVVRESITDPADVMFVKSIDGGLTFSTPIRINTDQSETNFQWFGTLSIAPNGRIDVIWLDTRDATNDINSVLYYSFSEDQGETWSENEAISIEFDPSLGYPEQHKLGDYFDMVSDNDFAHLSWANTFNGEQDVYYTRISPFGILGVDDTTETALSDIVIYPNPTNDKLYIKAPETLDTVVIFDMLGKEILRTKNSNIIDVSALQTGVYLVKLWDGSNASVRTLIVN